MFVVPALFVVIDEELLEVCALEDAELDEELELDELDDELELEELEELSSLSLFDEVPGSLTIEKYSVRSP